MQPQNHKMRTPSKVQLLKPFGLELCCSKPHFRDYFDYESHRGGANDMLKVRGYSIIDLLAGQSRDMDMTHVHCKGIHSPRSGFLYALKQVLRLKPGSLLWGGVPCSLLVWVSRSSSKRLLPGYDVMGDPFSKPTLQSNTLLSRFALLVLLCMSREVFWAIEQPQSLLLKDTPYYDYFFLLPQLKIVFTRMSEP